MKKPIKKKSEKQTDQSLILDLARISEFSARPYILDASAIMHDPYINDYSEKYKEIESPALFILINPVLQELDDIKHKSSMNSENHKFFMDRLRQYCKSGKLSCGQFINPRDYLIYLKSDIRDTNEKFPWLDNDYTDKRLMVLALELVVMGKKPAIISRDSLLKILCVEESIDYIYPDEQKEVSLSDTQSISTMKGNQI